MFKTVAIALTMAKASQAMPLVKQTAEETVENFRQAFQDMEQDDWFEYSGGLAIGTIIDLSKQVSWTGDCWKQLVSISENGYLAYYYYDQFAQSNNEDVMQLIYVSIYTAELAAAIQQGGCIAFENVNADQVLSWFTGGDSDIAEDTSATDADQQSFENPTQDIIDELDTLQAVNEVVDTSTTSEEEAETAEQEVQEKTEDPYDPQDFASQALSDLENLFNFAIDAESALINLDQERYVFAGVFSGRAAVELIFSLIGLYNQIAAGFAKEDTYGPSNGQISESQKEDSDAAFLDDF